MDSANTNVQIAENDNSAEGHEPYSIFTRSQKLGIVILVAFASCFSPLSSFIYYPGLTAVAKDLHATLSKVNLTTTSYMIVSGVAPSLFGSMADQVGRRPVYLLVFLLFIGLGYGVVGDITESSERGAYMGILGCGPNVAPSLGPAIGGILTDKAGWRWIFGFLAISGALSLILVAVLLPETGRNIVGNGSRAVPNWNRNVVRLWRETRRPSNTLVPQRSSPDSSEIVSRKASWRTPNPLGSVYILQQKESLPVILINGVFYGAYCCLQASLSSLFIGIYGYRELEAGLIYLPFGVGCFVASLLSRNILTQDYRLLAVRHGLPTSSADTSERQRPAFPIFHARLRSMDYLLSLSILPLLAYGWVLEYRLHPSIPLILQFFIGGAMTIIFNACGTLQPFSRPFFLSPHCLFSSTQPRATYPDLDKKVVLLTGIGQIGGDPSMWGNGAAIAKVLACENGAYVFGCDLGLDAAEYTKRRLELEGGICDVLAADVTDSHQVQGLVDACMQKYGRIDMLVNNVGRSEPGGPAEMDEATWDRQTNINLKTVYLTCHAVLPIMEKQQSGVVINISSVAGLRYVGKPQVAYAAAKAAIIQFSKTTAVLYARKGVRINTVVPGLMHTPLVRYLADKYAGGDLDKTIETRNEQVPMGHMGTAFDIANAAVFLMSDKAKYITGAEIVVDGGITCRTP